MEYTIKSMFYNSPETPEELLFKKQMTERIQDSFCHLTSKQIQVLCLRFGLDLDPTKIKFQAYEPRKKYTREITTPDPKIEYIRYVVASFHDYIIK